MTQRLNAASPVIYRSSTLSVQMFVLRRVFPALFISLLSCPLTLFLVLTFVFASAVVAIVLTISDSGPILMFVCPLALALALWTVAALVVVGGLVAAVALALVVR